MRSALTALALLLSAAGCGSPCGDLAGRICNCQPLGPLRDNCNIAVQTQLGSAGTPDQSFCQQKLATCPDPLVQPQVCDALNTAAGKAACGIAYPAGT